MRERDGKIRKEPRWGDNHQDEELKNIENNLIATLQ